MKVEDVYEGICICLYLKYFKEIKNVDKMWIFIWYWEKGVCYLK